MCCFTIVKSTLKKIKCAKTTFLRFNTDRRWVKEKKRQVYVGHSHFGASQCPQVIRSAQDGERAAGAKAISAQVPGIRPMHRRVENALQSENRQKSIKKMLGDYEIL